jgi:hypothetical protein
LALEIDDGLIDRLRLAAITAIDGLWFMAVERMLGFEAAFELDLEVWKSYGVVQLKRLSRSLGLRLDAEEPPDLETINTLLEALCRIDGTECSWEMAGGGGSVFTVHRCPWWENLCGSGRNEVVNCEVVDNTIFRHWLDNVDASIGMEITHSLPRGDDHCEWTLTREQR